jgi:hypothetical protein
MVLVAAAMLTRREVEGQLRTVHPLRAEALQRRQSMVRIRRWVRIGFISVLSILVFVTMVLTISASRVAPVPARRDAAWGVEHVNGYGRVKTSPIFGRGKKGGGGGSARRQIDPRWRFAH